MARTLVCEIVTPDAMLFSGSGVLVSAPASGGEIGMMYLCAPFMSTLKRGIIRINTEEGETIRFAVNGGYLEVDGYRVVILARSAVNVADIDKDASRFLIAQHEKHLAELADDDPQAAFAKSQIGWQQYLSSLI